MTNQHYRPPVENLTDEDMLDRFFLEHVMCWEGFTVDNDTIDAICEEFDLDLDCKFYVATGEMINRHYNLTGTNAYPETLPFLFLTNYYDVPDRIYSEAMWFDVIVERNIYQQLAIEEGGNNG